MGDSGARVPEVEIHRIFSTTSPEPPTYLHQWNTCKEDVGYLATIAYPHTGT
jgi:hypothetical protein